MAGVSGHLTKSASVLLLYKLYYVSRDGEHYIMCCFMIYNLHQILLRAVIAQSV
jgi:hypothetical protein